MPRHRHPLLAAVGAGALLAFLSACGGTGGPYGAPVVERPTTAAQPAAQAAERDEAGAEAAQSSDLEATVRPLGEAGGTRSRRLDDAAGPAAPEAGAQTPAATGLPEADGATPGAGEGEANPAVVSLLNAATAQSREGDYVAAAASLERALKIEPESPWLWHRLAEVRLHEGELDQAASLASKSNSLAVGAPRLQADNWKLIAEVRRRQGAPAAAATAEAQAASLLRAQ